MEPPAFTISVGEAAAELLQRLVIGYRQIEKAPSSRLVMSDDGALTKAGRTYKGPTS